MNIYNDNEIPIGFGLALAMNLDSMTAFTSLTKERQTEVIEQSKNCHSKSEMQQFVSDLSSKC